MAFPLLAEIKIFACNFAPRGWQTCDGQLIPIRQNTALFSLLGTVYGGDGQTTFGLPDLRNSAVLHAGEGPGLSPRVLAETGGVATVTLTVNQMPAHSHEAVGSSGEGSQAIPESNVWAGTGADRDIFWYHADPTGITMATDALSPGGGGQAHNNYMPYLGMVFCIATQGIFPVRDA